MNSDCRLWEAWTLLVLQALLPTQYMASTSLSSQHETQMTGPHHLSQADSDARTHIDAGASRAITVVRAFPACNRDAVEPELSGCTRSLL